MSKNNFSLGEYYHCFNRGVEKRKIFLTPKDYLRFSVLLYICNSNEPIHISNFEAKPLKDLFELKRGKPLVAVGAWVLMPNHFHILLKETREGGISLFMQKLTTGYTMYFNKKNQRTGSLLGGTFKSEHLNQDQYLKYVFAYIHLNPLKILDPKWRSNGFESTQKGLEFLCNYKWSSYLDYVGESRSEGKILDRVSFPNYFPNEDDFNSEINDWLSYGKV